MNNITITEEEYNKLKQKAEAYDEIENGIADFYSDENYDNDDIDLITIGEYIASYFGWL